MEKEPVIVGKNISVSYGDTKILEDVSFEIYPGEIFCIVGGSGCGKSTLLRQIIGLEKPTKGSIFIDGDNFSEANGKERRRILRKFGVLFQSGGLFASMTLAENIALVLEKYADLPIDRISELIDLKLSAVGLGGYDGFLPSEISGGMKKRAALARAMALDPKILCFDEPSSGLDPLTSAEMDKLIVSLNEAISATMVVVTHDLDSVMTIAHRIIMLDKSSKGIIAQGKPDELKKNAENEYVYNFFNRIA